MSEQIIDIDWTRCDGHGLCADLVPDRIALDEWGLPLIQRTTVRSVELKDTRRAVAMCPALALRLESR